MPSCSSIDPLVTPYIDGELSQAERDAMDQHLRACPPCRSRVNAEHAVQQLLGMRQAALSQQPAPPRLVERCARARAEMRRAARSSWRARLVPLAAAATLVLVVGGAFLYELTARSPRVMAAGLTADHLKCFALNTA